jgi:hypothetical protein
MSDGSKLSSKYDFSKMNEGHDKAIEYEKEVVNKSGV